MLKSYVERSLPQQTLTGDVKGTLLDWIREGQYPPGSRLPSVAELVEQFGVSRTVVREALQALVGMRLIDMRSGMGSFVRAVPAHMIVNADVMASLIDTETMLHVVRARKVIESAVAALAATEATEEDFGGMETIVEEIGATAARNQPVFAVTPKFHVALAKATHNPVLESVVASFNALMAKTGELLENEAGPGQRAREHASHRELLRVIRQRDPDVARRAMEEHIQQTLNGMNQLKKRPRRLSKAASR
jgi:GntR family transcriptional regulator, transcriptional repressor for pyruvate dehydrogenase complex